MRKGLLSAVAAIAVAASAPAFAGPTINAVSNGTTVSGTIIQAFSGNGPDGSHFTGGVNGTTTGVVNTYTQDVAGEAVINAQHSGDFLGIQNGTYTINLPTGTTMLSFLVGTLDSYNTVQLITSTGSYVLNGAGIAGGMIALGGGTGGSVTYTFAPGETLLSAIFSSDTKSFEIDSIASATPEPATWGMMILGFGLAGGAMRRRTRKLAAA